MTSQNQHPVPAAIPPANCFAVLVIDDLPANRMLLGKVLKGVGYAVIEAENGREAFELLRDSGILPDLIITDIEMPEMDGITLVAEIRRLETRAARLPIIAASGNADETMRREALAAGSDLFLTKPFDLATLKREVATLLKSRRTPAVRGEASSPDPGANRVEFRLREVG